MTESAGRGSGRRLRLPHGPVLWLALAAASSPLAGGAAPARGDDALDARFHDQEGRRLYRAGRYGDALESFLSSFRVAPSTGTLYNVGMAAALAREREIAYAFLERYVASVDDSPARRAAERRLARLARVLAVLEVTSEPPGAAVAVGDPLLGGRGRTPVRVAVAPGRRRLFLRLSGHQERELEVDAVAARLERIHVELPPRTGTLVLVGVDPTATLQVLRGEQIVAEGRGRLRQVLPVGRYLVRSAGAGAHGPEVPVLVTSESTVELRVEPPSARAPRGRLLVASGAVEAAVFVDGVLRGETPGTFADIPIGVHEVEVRAPGRRPWRWRGEVRADRATVLRADLGFPGSVPERGPKR
jgi:hypothetical protein